MRDESSCHASNLGQSWGYHCLGASSVLCAHACGLFRLYYNVRNTAHLEFQAESLSCWRPRLLADAARATAGLESNGV